MEIEFLIIADAVEAANGKLYMLGGGWDQRAAPAYPAPCQMGIAIGLSVPWDETNQNHSISISIRDADGTPVIPTIQGQVEVGRPPGLRLGINQRAMMAINAGFALPRPARYELCVALPNGVERCVAFEAVLAGSGQLTIQ
jgi:hypothetical protein